MPGDSNCPRVFNVHARDRTNIGDMMSSPVQYFPELMNVTTGIFSVHLNATQLVQQFKISKQDLLIVGGGGLLAQKKEWTHMLVHLCKAATCVLWAPGFNSQPGRQVPVEPLFKLAVASAIRDDAREYRFSPYPQHLTGVDTMLDASCLHPYFDLCGAPRHKRALYLHKAFTKTQSYCEACERLPRMLNNQSNILDVLSFLCDAEEVMSHGGPLKHA